MSGNEISSYCLEIESYLCRKNDGHLIRVAGPSFDLVANWASIGVPLKVAFSGIDRSFERYYRRGPRRRPLKIDFCEADVLDAFDDWKRALGITGRESGVESRESGVGSRESSRESGQESSRASSAQVDTDGGRVRRGPSLPEHLARVLLKLSAARAGGRLGSEFDDLLDRISRELDVARSDARGLRGDARQVFIRRLAALDDELILLARRGLGPADGSALEHDADDELHEFRATMTDDGYARARAAVVERLVRERFDLPVIAFRA